MCPEPTAPLPSEVARQPLGVRRAPAPGTLQLVFQSGQRRDEAVELVGPLASVGRSTRCNLVLQSEKRVSAEHARFQRRDDGWWLEDRGSTNGTLLNGVEVKAPCRVKDGDCVEFGRRSPAEKVPSIALRVVLSKVSEARVADAPQPRTPDRESKRELARVAEQLGRERVKLDLALDRLIVELWADPQDVAFDTVEYGADVIELGNTCAEVERDLAERSDALDARRRERSDELLALEAELAAEESRAEAARVASETAVREAAAQASRLAAAAQEARAAVVAHLACIDRDQREPKKGAVAQGSPAWSTWSEALRRASEELERRTKELESSQANHEESSRTSEQRRAEETTTIRARDRVRSRTDERRRELDAEVDRLESACVELRARLEKLVTERRSRCVAAIEHEFEREDSVLVRNGTFVEARGHWRKVADLDRELALLM